MKIIKRKLSELKEAPYNPRIMNEVEKNKLKESIKQFGLVQPLVLNEQTGYIVGGNQRLQALKELYGEDYEADIVLINISPEKEKALNIALNKISGDWDLSKLQSLLTELSDDDIVSTGLFNLCLNQ